jgi:hypothetical protein
MLSFIINPLGRARGKKQKTKAKKTQCKSVKTHMKKRKTMFCKFQTTRETGYAVCRSPFRFMK